MSLAPTAPSAASSLTSKFISTFGTRPSVAALGFYTDSRCDGLGFGEPDLKPRAATEGRPYSTCRGIN